MIHRMGVAPRLAPVGRWRGDLDGLLYDLASSEKSANGGFNGLLSIPFGFNPSRDSADGLDILNIVVAGALSCGAAGHHV